MNLEAIEVRFRHILSRKFFAEERRNLYDTPLMKILDRNPNVEIELSKVIHKRYGFKAAAKLGDIDATAVALLPGCATGMEVVDAEIHFPLRHHDCAEEYHIPVASIRTNGIPDPIDMLEFAREDSETIQLRLPSTQISLTHFIAGGIDRTNPIPNDQADHWYERHCVMNPSLDVAISLFVARPYDTRVTGLLSTIVSASFPPVRI